MQRGRILIGTSGWHYPHWVGPVYPEGARPDSFLVRYARRFRSVEINTTFYGLPAPATLAHWRDATPPGFVFACKASRLITHRHKLAHAAEATARFLDAIALLGAKRGPVLFQLPPRWRADADRLATFLAALPAGSRYAFEFRDRSWFTPAVYARLARHGAALCLYDLAGWRSPVRVTAPFVYLRLHGPGAAYRGRYDGRTLSGWARRIAAWRRQGRDVYCYFDNDEGGHAAADAARLSAMLGPAGGGGHGSRAPAAGPAAALDRAQSLAHRNRIHATNRARW